MNPFAILALVLGLLLAGATYQWLQLHTRQRQRGILGRWPIRRVPIEELDSRFVPDALGPTLAAEVRFIGRGSVMVPGGTSDAEASILAVLATDAMRMFEFGTCTGKTTYLWARNQPPDGRVTTLTLAPDQLAAYQVADGDEAFALEHARIESAFTHFRYTGTDVESHVEQLFGDSKIFDESAYVDQCDVVFVDGSHAHSYVVSDSAKALRMVRPGGIVLWHDYNSATKGVFRALNELSKRLPLVHLRGTDLVAYRRPL
jgi:predicted O-methyltransferase YrrM